MNIPIQNVEQSIKRALARLGYDDSEAADICAVLMYAQLRGSSRGVAELLTTGRIEKRQPTHIDIQKETVASAYIDAHGAHAMLAVSRAVDIAAHKAKQAGIAVVTVHHTSAASGALGYYPHKLASHGLIGIVMATTPPMVAPAGTCEPIFGANPLAIAIPTMADPLVLDMDTAALAFPGVRALAATGKPLPEGIAYDNTGNLTTSPAAALMGAMRPFDKGYKGSHLTLMVQILAGALAGSGAADDNSRGHFILAIDPEILCGAAELHAQVAGITTAIKNAKTIPGVTEALLPGELEDRIYQEAMRTGEVAMDEALYDELVSLGR